MVTLQTLVFEYLDLCETRGANDGGDCPSFDWARKMFTPETKMTEALNKLEDAGVAMEAAMFAFEFMLSDISPAVRWRFARVVANDPNPVVHALTWKRLTAAQSIGAEAPTEKEDQLLRASWHSRWQGSSVLPEYERELT